MTLQLAFELPALALGLLFGSFLNVCISRLPHHRSIVKPRSNCPQCGTTIRWYDNIPLLSWLLLRARCRHCKKAIPWRYPLVELATGAWFVTLAGSMFGDIHLFRLAEHGLPLNAGARDISMLVMYLGIAILGFLLIGLMVMDWQTHTLPDAFTFTGIAIGFLLACVRAMLLPLNADQIQLHGPSPLSSPGAVHDQGNVILTGPEALIGRWLLATLGAALILLAVRWLYQALRHREGLGLGDVKLLAMIAAFLGFWPAVLALFSGVLLASLYALTLLARRRADAATRLPLGSFLAIGGLFSALFATSIIEWYKTLL